MKQFKLFSDKYGFSVVPLNGKACHEKGWTDWAYEKRPFDEAEFEGRNAGAVLPPGIAVIDVDIPERFEGACVEHDWHLPETLTVRTGSQKHHYYYRTDDDYAFKPANLNEHYGFEVRGVGQLMALPGSIHPETGEQYVLERELPFAPLPGWVKDLLHVAQKKCIDNAPLQTNEKFLAALNAPAKTKRLIETGFSQGCRSEKMFSVLSSLASAGYGIDTMEYVLRHYPIGEKARQKGDQWMKSEIERALAKSKSHNAGNERRNSFREAEPYCRFLSVMNDKNTETEWLLEGLVPAGEYGYLVAPGSTGKGLFALKLAYSLTSGNNLFGRLSVGKPGKVLYCSYEDNTAVINSRLSSLTPGRQLLDEALKDREARARSVFQKASGGRWYVVGDAHNEELLGHLLQSPTEQDGEVKALQDNLVCFGAERMSGALVLRGRGSFKPSKTYDDLLEYASDQDNLRLIVIDTQAQAAGETEGSNAEASVFNSCMQRLVQETGATVLVSAHTTKKAAMHKDYRRALADHSQRGPSAFYSAARFQLTMVPRPPEEYASDKDNEHTSYVAMKSTKCNYPDHLKEILTFRKHSEKGSESFELADRDKTASELADWIADKVVEEQLTQRDFIREYGKRSGNPVGAANGEFVRCLNRCIKSGRVIAEPHSRGGYTLRPPCDSAPATD